MRKFWIKLWTEEWLDGSVRFELSPQERGIFIDLLALAGRSRNPGVVASNETTPYPKAWLAGKLGVSLEDLKTALAKFIAQGRVEETEYGLAIINWSKYQSPNSKSPPHPTLGVTPPEKREFIYPEHWNEHIRRNVEVLLSLPAFSLLAQKGAPGFIAAVERWATRLGDRDGKEVLAELYKFQEWWADKQMKRPFSALTNWFWRGK